MLKMIKKELRQMFSSPAYFVILAVFIGILNFLFLKAFFVNWQMNFRSYFDLQIWFLMIFIPAISMRIMSEEFKNGSIEFLLTKPISLLKIIFWKYLSLWIYFSIFILSTIVLYYSLSGLWNFIWWIIVSQLIWSILLILTMFSISFLASSITKNQVFAFLLWVLINFIFIIIWTDFIQLSLPYFLSNFLNWISYISHNYNFAKWLISISDIFYYLSVIFFSIYLSYLSINNYKKIWKVWLWLWSTMEVLIILLVLIFSNAIFAKTNIFFDMTPNKAYTLSNATKNILNSTNDIINLELYVSKELPPQLKPVYINTKDLIKQFNNYSWNNLHLKEIHPVEDNKEKEALQNWISPIQAQILKDDKFTTQKLYLWLVIKYIDKTEIIRYLWENKNLEYTLISKILKITNNKKKTVSIIYSDDINNRIIYSINQVLSDNYDVSLNKISNKIKFIRNISSDINLILEWDNKFGTWVINDIKNNLKGKTTLYFFQPTKVSLTNGLLASKNQWKLSKQLLSKFNLSIKDWIVWDFKYNSMVNVSQWFMNFSLPYPFFPKTFVNKKLPISQWINNINTPFISWLAYNWTWSKIKDLLSTSKYGFNYNKLYKINPSNLDKVSESNLSKISLAKFIDNWNFKIAFIPDTYMFTMWWEKALMSNLKFVSNLVDYLWWDSRLIDIRWKSISYENFVAKKWDKFFIRWLNIFALPIILLIIWLSIAFIRNRKRT